MVKVAPGTNPFAVSPRFQALGRLQELKPGVYRTVSVSELSVDRVSFSPRPEVAKLNQDNQPRWRHLNEAAKRTVKAGAIVAGSILGGLLGAGLPGAIVGGLLTWGAMRLLQHRSAKPVEAVKVVKPEKTNPFQLAPTEQKVTDAVDSSSREQAKARLKAELEAIDAMYGSPTEVEAFLSRPMKKEPKFAGLPLRNLPQGLLSTDPSSLLSNRLPSLRFRTVNTTPKAALKKLENAPVFLNTATHSVTEPIALVTLGKQNAQVNVFDLTAKDSAQAFSKETENVVWGPTTNAHGIT